jgi:peptidyl-prolyl cis-trans isomerase A (cyclophilin A)
MRFAARLASLGLILIVPAAKADDNESLVIAARTVVDRFANGEFAELARNVDPESSSVLSAEKLREIWNDVVQKAGAFQRIVEVRPERRGTGDYVMVTCAFATRRYDLRLRFNEKQQVSTMRFVPSALGGPGLITVTSAAPVRPATAGGEGTVTFPVPGTYREQAPIDFVVRANPPNALKSYRLRRRGDGLNWLCEVHVAPPKDGAVVRWEALVLVGDRTAEPLPKAVEPEVPEAGRPWLKNTHCVQSDDPAIKAKADDLAKDTSDVESYARKVIAFTGNVPVDMKKFVSLDARNALDCGGSCTSRANLAAALLRARGIPARTVAHLPTWAGLLYEHWLVEYWHPGKGWVWLESSLNQFQPRPSTLVVINVASPADEDDPTSFAPAAIRNVVAGAPFLSVQELSKELLPSANVPTGETLGSLATPEVALACDADEFRALLRVAGQAFDRLPKERNADTAGESRAEKLLDAARTGGAKALGEMLARDVEKTQQPGGANVRVLIRTENGDIEAELYPEQAPLTVANFLRYVDGHLYDGGTFHRTVTLANQPDNKIKIEVIQAGPDPAKKELPPIKLERTRDTKLSHKDGTLSMARDGPDTATGDFFICIGDQPVLDFGGKRNPDGQGFAAFGRVTKGMEVARAIQASPADGQTLKPAVRIVSVRRTK